jgi:4-hydroxy-3-methylbut-2-enyl diphosphate reductase
MKAGQSLKNGRMLYSLGEIVHNPGTVESLKKRGMKFVGDVSEIPSGSRFLVRSHGLPETTLKDLKKKKLKICDGTCVKIKKIQAIIKDLTRKKIPILIIGKPSHPEVMAVASLAKGRHWVMESVSDLEKLPDTPELAVVIQTTFNPLVFRDFISALVLIIGGKNSSNTRTLFELVSGTVRSFAIEDESELDPSWFYGVRAVALISGASTPIEDVRKVQNRIREIEEAKGN